MNTADLKLIVDMINNLGAAGKDAFIWWLVMNYGLSALVSLAAYTLAGFIFVVIARAFVRTEQLRSHRTALSAARDALLSAYIDLPYSPTKQKLRDLFSEVDDILKQKMQEEK